MLALVALAGVAAPALADDAERLEADLRSLFGEHGEVEIGEVSSALLRSRVTAEEVVFRGEEGERLSIARYVVSGDYDSPDEVTLEGVRLEDDLSELALVEVERIVLGEPSRAVFPLDDSLAPQDVRIGSLAIDDITLDLASELAEKLFHDASLDDAQGRMTIARVRGESLSHEAIGSLEITDVAGTGENLGDVGAGSFSLAALAFEGLTGIDREGEERLEAFELRDFTVDSDRLVGGLERLSVDGDFTDGEGGVRLEAFHADLARMIELAPEEERAQLRMASNALTDGSGELRLDAAFLGSWEASDDHSLITSDSQVAVHDALRLLLDVSLPMVLPDGVAPEAVFMDDELLEGAMLLGGEIHLTLAEQGLFGRLATLGAAKEGISEAQYLEQAKTQAEGFGMMFGPEVQQFFLGLVALAEGTAEEVELTITLPAESKVATYTDDPLALSDKLSLSVETR
ncbi:hypothetical protein EQG41_19460 [Billgrantia azerbaijanica]|nr:hypothetical protein EQG41_19460 [Halomonas azerbaijanica]